MVESCVPRYFFDIHDGKHLIRDDVGTDCIGSDAIRAEAIITLPAIARDVIPKEGDQQTLTVIVRNTSNITVFTAILTFASIWLGEDLSLATDDFNQTGHIPLTWGR
jgi:hypothetical protein